jgi:hypothetical protein
MGTDTTETCDPGRTQTLWIHVQQVPDMYQAH